MSLKRDEDYLCGDEEEQSPPPNVSRSDPHVGLEKEEHERDEEEKMDSTEEDPRDGHIPVFNFYQWWARNEALGAAFRASDTNDRIDDMIDPGMSSCDKDLKPHLKGPYDSTSDEEAEAVKDQPQAPNVSSLRRHQTRPGVERVDGIGYTGLEDDCTVIIGDGEEGTVELSPPPTVSAQLFNSKEVENRAVQNFLQNAVVADVVPEVAPDNTSSRRWKLAIIVFVLILIVIGVVLAITLPTRNPTPTVSPEALSALLSSVSSDKGEALLNSSTPQHMAFNWMATNNTNLDSYSNEQIIQRYALATLFYSANGESWINNESWLDNGKECGRWQTTNARLICTDTESVSTLFLNNNNLTGTLPPEIGLLTGLEALWLTLNNLRGNIPSKVGALTQLTTLDLSFNELTGTIPSEIDSLVNLDYLFLYGNMLTGNYTCPNFVERCWISCDYFKENFTDACRSS